MTDINTMLDGFAVGDEVETPCGISGTIMDIDPTDGTIQLDVCYPWVNVEDLTKRDVVVL